MSSDRQTAQTDDQANQKRQAAKPSAASAITGSAGEPVRISGLNARQSSVLRKQQTIGNAAVVRQLRSGTAGTSSLSAGAIQRVPEGEQNPEAPLPMAESQPTTASEAGSANTIQRDDAATWTVPATVTPPLQAANSAAIETLAYSQQLASSVEMTSAGWSALVGTKIKGSPPEPVRQSGAAARSQSNSAKSSIGAVTGGLDQARSVLSDAVQQGGADVVENN